MLADLKKTKGIDLLARFQALAPHHDPISIQRWSTRRIRLAAGALLGVLILLSLIIDNIRGVGFL